MILLAQSSLTLHLLFAILHALAGAAWFGSMFYSLTLLHPRAKAFFADDEKYEEFAATISRGARWKVLAAFALVLLSGLALIPLTRPHPLSSWWLAILITKSILFLLALAVFCYASWHLWPARIFATPAEIPAIQRRFRRVGLCMILLVALNLALGVVAHIVRG